MSDLKVVAALASELKAVVASGSIHLKRLGRRQAQTPSSRNVSVVLVDLVAGVDGVMSLHCLVLAVHTYGVRPNATSALSC